jgi:hypothetical protein
MIARLLVLSSVILFAKSADAITVEDAYRAIPHEQVTYDPNLSSRSERFFLQKLFIISDRALVQRIEGMTAMSKGNKNAFSAYSGKIDSILTDLDSLDEPSIAQGMKAQLKTAIESQRSFFRRWNEALRNGTPFKSPSGERESGIDGDISRASSALHSLYYQLNAAFPEEAPHNKSSFFQHLCALDFI